MLNEKGATEWEKFVKIEETAVLDDEDEGKPADLLMLAFTGFTDLYCLKMLF